MNGAYQLVTELIDFFKNGKVTGSLTNAADMVGERTLRVIAINLLPWMKRILRPKPEPLQLLQDYPWCLALTELIKEDSSFRTLLVVEGGGVFLNSRISKEEISKIQEVCTAAYNPPLMR